MMNLKSLNLLLALNACLVACGVEVRVTDSAAVAEVDCADLNWSVAPNGGAQASSTCTTMTLSVDGDSILEARGVSINISYPTQSGGSLCTLSDDNVSGNTFVAGQNGTVDFLPDNGTSGLGDVYECKFEFETTDGCKTSVTFSITNDGTVCVPII